MAIRVMQTELVHAPTTGRFADCFQACIASLFELPLDGVPHFAKEQREEWQDGVNDWLAERGFYLLRVADERQLHGHYMAVGPVSGFVNFGQHSVIRRYGRLWHNPDGTERDVESGHLFVVASLCDGKREVAG